MEENTTIKLQDDVAEPEVNIFEEAKIALFSAVKNAQCEDAQAIVQQYPGLINASQAFPLIHSILYAAKREVGKDDELKEQALLFLAKFVLNHDECDIFQKDQNRNTALHRAIWYVYPEIVEIIIAKAGEKKHLKEIFSRSIRNRHSETPLNTLLRAFNTPEIATSENQPKLEAINTLLINAQQLERRRKLSEASFAHTAETATQEFYSKLQEEILEDHIDFELLTKPMILPEGQTYSNSSLSKNFNPSTRTPFTDSQKIPHYLAQSLVDLYNTFPAENSVMQFFSAVESLLYCPVTGKRLENPRVIAQQKIIGKNDFYGHTCNNTAVDETVITYQDILIEEVLEFKAKYDKKLVELEQEAKQLDGQGSVPDKKPEITLTCVSSESDRSATGLVSDWPKYGHSGGKILQVFSDKEYIEKIEKHLTLEFNTRFDDVEYSVTDDGTRIEIKIPDGPTLDRLSNFFAEQKEIFTWEGLKTGETRNKPGTQPPSKVFSAVFSTPQTQPKLADTTVLSSSKQIFPQPVAMKYEMPKYKGNPSYIIITYNPDDIFQIANAVKKLTSFCKIQRKKNEIFIEIDPYQYDVYLTGGAFMKKEWGKEMLFLKFPDAVTKDSFMDIFNLAVDRQFIAQDLNDKVMIKIDPQLFKNYQEEKQRNSICLMM